MGRKQPEIPLKTGWKRGGDGVYLAHEGVFLLLQRHARIVRIFLRKGYSEAAFREDWQDKSIEAP